MIPTPSSKRTFCPISLSESTTSSQHNMGFGHVQVGEGVGGRIGGRVVVGVTGGFVGGVALVGEIVVTGGLPEVGGTPVGGSFWGIPTALCARRKAKSNVPLSRRCMTK